MVRIGSDYELTFSVSEEHTARAVGSGTLPVLATPVLAAKLEECAWRAAAPFLPADSSTVGTHLDLNHLSPTPVGMSVICRAEVTAAEGRSLTFSLSAHDAAGPVGKGTHERVVIQDVRFLSKAQSKAGLSADPTKSAE